MRNEELGSTHDIGGEEEVEKTTGEDLLEKIGGAEDPSALITGHSWSGTLILGTSPLLE